MFYPHTHTNTGIAKYCTTWGDRGSLHGKESHKNDVSDKKRKLTNETTHNKPTCDRLGVLLGLPNPRQKGAVRIIRASGFSTNLEAKKQRSRDSTVTTRRKRLGGEARAYSQGKDFVEDKKKDE